MQFCCNWKVDAVVGHSQDRCSSFQLPRRVGAVFSHAQDFGGRVLPWKVEGTVRNGPSLKVSALELPVEGTVRNGPSFKVSALELPVEGTGRDSPSFKVSALELPVEGGRR